MKRNEFLSTFTGGFSAACVSCLALSCSKDESGAPSAVNMPNTSSGLSINLDSELKSINDFVAKSGYIIIRTASGNTPTSFLAVSSVCPHAGATVEYKQTSTSFLCSTHGSTFSATGALVLGPATRGLSKFEVEIIGTTLRLKA